MQASDEKLLYHFTTAESLFKIIENMTLKFSTFDNLNDLNEKELNFGFFDSFLPLQIERYIVENCKLISFTRDYNRFGENKGINHPRMWAQYAGNNTGACIVINEKKFKKINSEILKKAFCKIENVEYKGFIFNGEYKDDVEPKLFIEKEYKKLFFLKHVDWKNEDERRLFYIGEEKYLTINNCVKYICLGNKFNNYDELIHAATISAFKGNQFLSPYDFYKISASSRGVSGFDNSPEIFKQIAALNDVNLNYVSKLKKIWSPISNKMLFEYANQCK